MSWGNAFASGKGYLGDNLFTIQQKPPVSTFDSILHFPSPPFGFTGFIAHLIAPAWENIMDGDVPCDTFRLGYLL